MSESLEAPIPFSPDQRVVFKYFVYGTRIKMNEAHLGEVGAIVTPPPGTWYWLNPGEAPYIVCPRCGTAGHLSGYAVAPNGNINPSIACSTRASDDKLCGANYYGRLDFYKTAGTA